MSKTSNVKNLANKEYVDTTKFAEAKQTANETKGFKKFKANIDLRNASVFLLSTCISFFKLFLLLMMQQKLKIQIHFQMNIVHYLNNKLEYRVDHL